MAPFVLLLRDLDWRVPVLVVAGVVAALGAWRGRVGWTMALPLIGAAVTQHNTLRIASALPAVYPEVRATSLASGWQVAMTAPVLSGLLAMGLLPGLAGAGRTWLNGVTAGLGVLWILAGLSLRQGQGTQVFQVAAALAMGLASAVLLRRRPVDSARPSRLVAYACFATLIAAASVPDVYVMPHGHATISPAKRCAELYSQLNRGMLCALWALLATPIALVPLWVEARRTNGRAGAVTGALILSAIGLSTLPIAVLTGIWMRAECAPPGPP